MSGHPELGPGETLRRSPDAWLQPASSSLSALNWSMRPRETLNRLDEFQVDDKRRRIAQIERTINDFEQTAAGLEREIQAEEILAGIHDPSHYAYPTYAKAAIIRRDNLKRSIQKLKEKL